MIDRKTKLQVAIFLLGTIGLLVVTVVLLVGMKFFEKKDLYNIRYKNVSISGLHEGSTVQFRGVKVGVIEEVYIDPKDVESVIVAISLKRGTPVKQDTEAAITNMGITGLKFIELVKGTNASKHLKPGSYILAGASLMDELTDKAEVISSQVQQVLANLILFTGDENRERFTQLVDNIDGVVVTLHEVLDENRGSLTAMMRNLDQMTTELRTVAGNLEGTMRHFRQLVTREDLQTLLGEIQTTLAHTRATLDGLGVDQLVLDVRRNLEGMSLPTMTKRIDDLLTRTDKTVEHLDVTVQRSREDVYESLDYLREALENFRDFTRTIGEDPSLLFRSKNKEERRLD
ncbi:MAG: hypothetical protein A2284_12550 [Deltaproteobacteria bacterium RIFOXYA12_FULL_61_11]|nr:MAG: hypothetical protein A2284_12550 [Deltaproteobacteria bacterium RIFOXYA12_FULL_61_11]